ELFKIGIPLLPTFLIYWIFNSMDRIMINRMIGSTELGIYSVGSKVSSISQLIYTAFAGGWSYFAFSTMKDKDQVELNSKVFEYLGIISFVAYICAQPFIKTVFKFFLTGEYQRGSEVFAYLFLSPLMLMLFQITASQVIVVKKSYLSTLSLTVGAILNVFLNYYLIKYYGIRGAAVSTLFSYIISVVMIMIVCYKYKLMKLKPRFIIISGILFTGILVDFFVESYQEWIYILVLLSIGIGYFGDIKKIIKGRLK
ncbi:MAG: lipopolysaccharide biosynthesis protein, partial [Fusobacteriaceae bacterium]